MTETKNIIDNISQLVKNLESKEFKFIFLVPDTKGNPIATVSNLYRHAYSLKQHGYNVAMLTEKKDFISVDAWLDCKFTKELDHYTIEENKLTVSTHDFLIIPELYGAMLKELVDKKVPCEKVLFINSFEYVSDAFDIAKSFSDMGVIDTITTSDTIAELLKSFYRVQNVRVVNPLIPSIFKPSDKLAKPVIGIHFRDQLKTRRFIKLFIEKYPLYRFISFLDFHGMPEDVMAQRLSECMVSTWSDDISSFGTFPVESIKCGVPVIGRVPNIIPEWIDDKNGIWCATELDMVDALGRFVKGWLEDKPAFNVTNVQDTLADKYTETIFNEQVKTAYEDLVSRKIVDLNNIKEYHQTQLKEDNNE
jgi:glycosyltransferase involved in cell wall biosynthesis